jgi:hypothetical protein
MYYGKSCTSIDKTFLSLGKKLASNACQVCLASLKEVKSADDIWSRPFAIPKMMGYSCTTRIRINMSFVDFLY